MNYITWLKEPLTCQWKKKLNGNIQLILLV